MTLRDRTTSSTIVEAAQQRFPPWSVIGPATGYGQSVSFKNELK
jgi:hypothetical protein